MSCQFYIYNTHINIYLYWLYMKSLYYRVKEGVENHVYYRW